MIILIGGSSHTGKTLMAQKLLEKYKFPYLSIDHLKMGLIRSGKTNLTPENDEELTDYLWLIVREIIKTAVENRQNLIVEGCYIPFDWKKDFEEKYLEHMRYFCLIMAEKYIQKNFSKIKGYANIIEKRVDDSACTKEMMIEENIKNFEMCQKCDCDYILIDDEYVIEI
ncbi:adenylate kinase [Fusobacterium ulcerans]|uniref:adenylate kinase n=1 Tax=Fusobacterium ulcerans TaxID=861 RepID=UPI002E79EFB1|nr:adenylate kinase [Fusobacterium ulcerans]MEE0137762.1 adenylate kinase [Fusobacterium ulcerans]